MTNIYESWPLKELRKDLEAKGYSGQELSDALGTAKALNPDRYFVKTFVTNYMEQEAMAQAQMEKERALLYGKEKV